MDMRNFYLGDFLMNNAKELCGHTVTLDMRRKMEITGVLEVISFDDSEVVLVSECGELAAEGRGIRIEVLDTARGVVTLEGEIDALYYSEREEKKKKGRLGRLSG